MSQHGIFSHLRNAQENSVKQQFIFLDSENRQHCEIILLDLKHVILFIEVQTKISKSFSLTFLIK